MPEGLEPGSGPPEPNGQVEVYRTTRAQPARERTLVLQAVGIDHLLVSLAGEHRLLVAGRDARAAVEQLRRFEAENSESPAPDDGLLVRAGFRAGATLWCLLLVAGFLAERTRAFGLPWWSAGEAEAARLHAGEVWRAVTALCLHADLAHLCGNLAFGALFVGFTCQLVGTGTGLLATLLTGALGNLAAGALRDAGGSSVGASTAVFGALGLLAALQWRRRGRRQAPPLRRWTPVVAAVLLLAYLGASGQNVDVLAHAGGFVCGLLLGAALEPRFERALAGAGAQLVQGFAALALVVASWAAAFARG